MITAGVMMIVMFSIIIPFDKTYSTEKGYKIDFTKQKCIFVGMYLIRFRLCLAVYACICKH